MLRMIVPYGEWLTISRGSSTEKSPAFSNLVKLSASDETVGFIDEPTAVTDRYAVLTPKHHPFCCNVLLSEFVWPYTYRRFNQGINFSFKELEHIVFPEVVPAALDELEPIFREIHTLEQAKAQAMVYDLMVQFKSNMLNDMFVNPHDVLTANLFKAGYRIEFGKIKEPE